MVLRFPSSSRSFLGLCLALLLAVAAAHAEDGHSGKRHGGDSRSERGERSESRSDDNDSNSSNAPSTAPAVSTSTTNASSTPSLSSTSVSQPRPAATAPGTIPNIPQQNPGVGALETRSMAGTLGLPVPSFPDIHLPHIDLHLPPLNLTPLWTDELRAGRDAYAAGNYASARGHFGRASEAGNMVADWYLGHMFRLGRGVQSDPAIAFSYFNRVIDGSVPGDPDPYRLRILVDARIRAADYVRVGIPSARIAANPQAAVRVYLDVATNYGHPRALYELGVMSIEGEGMEQRAQRGLKWLNAAIRKRSPEAAAYLGQMYEEGNVVAQDDVKALQLYFIAASMARKGENPEIFSRLMELQFGATQETRLEAQARARVWLEQNPLDQAQ